MLSNKVSKSVSTEDILEIGDRHPEFDMEAHLEEAQNLINEFFALEINYESALMEINTKLNILNNEFLNKQSRNPIHNMKSRVKSPLSILEKLIRKGLDLNIRTAREKINDIAGIRIICPYIKDIYNIKQQIENQNDLQILETVDYIKSPKPNGYRSLHMIMNVPVFFSNRKETVKVEIQIRTIAMDFWASLEHQLRYKTLHHSEIPSEISDELKYCADVISQTDIKMQDIHSRIFDNTASGFH